MNQLTGTKARQIARVLAEHPELSWLGYGMPGEDAAAGRVQLASPESTETITRAAGWVTEHLAERKAINPRCTSYGLKHLAEPDIGYATNGQFIAALLLAGSA